MHHQTGMVLPNSTPRHSLAPGQLHKARSEEHNTVSGQIAEPAPLPLYVPNSMQQDNRAKPCGQYPLLRASVTQAASLAATSCIAGCLGYPGLGKGHAAAQPLLNATGLSPG